MSSGERRGTSSSRGGQNGCVGPRLEGQPLGERSSFIGEDSSIGEAGQGRKYYKRR